MSLRETLLARIAEHCRANGIDEREFGYAAMQDGRFVGRLKDGAVTLKVMEKAEAYLDGKAADARASRRKNFSQPAIV